MGLIWSLILGAIAGFIATGIMHENTLLAPGEKGHFGPGEKGQLSVG